MTNDSAVFLASTGQKTGDILECNQRDVEAIAEADEARALHRRVDVEGPRQHRGLIGNNADRAAIHSRKSYDNVLRVMLVHFEEIAVVDHGMDHVLDVI